MTRILSILTTALMLFALSAQSQIKVNVEGLMDRLDQSDKDIAHTKRGVRASTWVDRGRLFTEIFAAPTGEIYKGMKQFEMILLGEKDTVMKKTVGNMEYDVVAYPYYDAYLYNGIVEFWDIKKRVMEDANLKGIEALEKAYSIDKKASNIKETLTQILNLYKQESLNRYALQEYSAAAKAFRDVYYLGLNPIINIVDTSYIFNAGYCNTITNNYKDGADDLNEALKYKYYRNGETHYYLYHCYAGLKDTLNARKVIVEGMVMFPTNNDIVEATLSVYTRNGGDAESIIPIVLKALEADSNNIQLWGGLGRIHDKLGNLDESIKAFRKSAELLPDDFNAQFNIGLLYIKKSDKINEELSVQNFTSQKEYDEAYVDVFAYYEKSIAPLENALRIDPTNIMTVELLKGVTFRLRDKGMGEKYEMYDKMMKEMSL